MLYCSMVVGREKVEEKEEIAGNKEDEEKVREGALPDSTQ